MLETIKYLTIMQLVKKLYVKLGGPNYCGFYNKNGYLCDLKSRPEMTQTLLKPVFFFFFFFHINAFLW